MFNIRSTVVVIVGFATLGDDVLDFLDEILLDFWNSYAEERLAQHSLIGGEDLLRPCGILL